MPWVRSPATQGSPARPDSLNALLPYDIAVIECAAAAPGFDARRDATSRAYVYRVLTRRSRSAFERRRALHWPHPLDAGALRACASLLVGEHDFTAFTPTETDHVRFERVVLSATWEAAGAGLLEFRIEADAFMRNMVRVLVGTMLDVGGGRRSAEAFGELLRGVRAPRREPPRRRRGCTSWAPGTAASAFSEGATPAWRYFGLVGDRGRALSRPERHPLPVQIQPNPQLDGCSMVFSLQNLTICRTSRGAGVWG